MENQRNYVKEVFKDDCDNSVKTEIRKKANSMSGQTVEIAKKREEEKLKPRKTKSQKEISSEQFLRTLRRDKQYVVYTTSAKM